MIQFINFCNYIFSKIVEILNSITFGDSPSLLKFMLASIIIGFIIKLVKGGTNEFDQSMNFSTGYLVQSTAVRYQRNKERQRQLVQQQKSVNRAFRNGYVAGVDSKLTTFDKMYADAGVDVNKGY